jgi:hypothetical protein
MTIDSDEGFVLLIAKDDAEAALLPPIVEAINAEVGRPFSACLVDRVQDGLPGGRILNGILQLQIS